MVSEKLGELCVPRLIGVLPAILPAPAATISNILAYDQAKKGLKEPEKFGTGSCRGDHRTGIGQQCDGRRCA